MSISINESGITFGDFLDDDVFEIEKVLTGIDFGKGIYKVEFIFHNPSGNGKILLVEAKSSIPRESKEFFAEIRLKMIHSLTLWFTAVCGRHENITSFLPESLKNSSQLILPIHMCLVIPEVPDNMLPQFTDKFRACLSVERKIWAIKYSDIMVLNKDKARKYGLVDRV